MVIMMGDSEAKTPTVLSSKEELLAQIQQLKEQTAQLTRRCNRFQREIVPDIKPHTLVDDLVEEEDFVEFKGG
eukprot:12765435-Ditylum_brightwellii.AAC.1